MPAAWRIVKASRAAEAFSGEGARLFGGRWSSPGRALIYTSQHLGTAALEIYVHLRPLAPRGSFVAFPLTIPAALIERIRVESLPPEWRLSPPGNLTMQIGDTWAKERRSAILALPSAVIPEETNFVLNPAHADFAKILVGSARPFTFDQRLVDP